MTNSNDEAQEEFLGYRLVIVVAGPNYRDIVEIESEDPAELEPTFHDVSGLTYERYPGEGVHSYLEVRFDYVVSRRLELIRKPPEPEPVTGTEGDERQHMTIIRPGGDRSGD